MKIINCQTLGEMCEVLLDGEPVFVLRAQDAATVQTIRDYIANSKSGGGANIIRSEVHLHRIEEWQAANPNRVKAAN